MNTIYNSAYTSDVSSKRDLFNAQRSFELKEDLCDQLISDVSLYGVTEEYAKNSLSKVSRGDLAKYLLGILCDEKRLNDIAKRSYYHPNGFLKLQLSISGHVKVRLHYWSAKLISAEENVHNHRWRLASKVMHGQLHSEVFKEVIPDHSDSTLKEKLTLRLYHKQIGDHSATGQEFGEVCVQKSASITRLEGEVYAMDTDQLHRIKHHNGQATVTLMVQSAPLHKDNHMLSRKNVQNPELDPVCMGEGSSLKPLIKELIALLTD